MTDREQAKAKDDILRYMLDNPKYINGFGNSMENVFSSSNFYTALFNRKLKETFIERLIEQILEHPNTIVDNPYDKTITLNEITQRFIDDGGFVGIYDAEIQRLEDLKQRQILADDAEKVSREKDKVQLKILNWQKKTFWYIFIFGLIGGLYSIYKISQSIFKPSNNVTQEILDSRLDSIKIELEALKTAKIEVVKKSVPVVIDTIKPIKK